MLSLEEMDERNTGSHFLQLHINLQLSQISGFFKKKSQQLKKKKKWLACYKNSLSGILGTLSVIYKRELQVPTSRFRFQKKYLTPSLSKHPV